MAKAPSPDLWDTIAKTYDHMRPDQGLTDPNVRAAWQAFYAEVLSSSDLHLLDAGCGTGSLSLALAETGHQVTGIDFAPAMIAEAKEKAELSGLPVSFAVMDAVSPDFEPGSFDAITCRQVLWALPDRKAALENWANLLRPDGHLILIEGLFASGNGMAEDEVLDILPASLEHLGTRDLAQNHRLWGGPISDQRYCLVAKTG